MTVVLYSGLERKMARHPGVQGYLDDLVFEYKARAEALIVEHRQEGHAAIETAKGRIDRYLILSDDRGQMAALSIEYGRAGYIDPETGELWGSMEGLYILTRATNIPKRRRKFKRLVRRKGWYGGKKGRR